MSLQSYGKDTCPGVPQATQLNRKGTASEYSRGQNRLVPKMLSLDTGAGLCAIRTSIVESLRGYQPNPLLWGMRL